MITPDTFYKRGDLGFPAPEILEETELQDGSFVKKMAKTLIVDHKTSGRRIESMTLEEYRKTKKVDPWTQEPTSKIFLDNEALKKLVKYLLAHKEFIKLQATTNYTLLDGKSKINELTIDEKNALADLIKVSAEQNILDKLVKPETVANINAAIQQSRYKSAIAELKLMISQTTLSEQAYKDWFTNHSWVFGTEYLESEESTKIGWRSSGDIILRSTDGYEDIIELKLPKEEVLVFDKSHNNWYPSSGLSQAIAQVIKYFQESEDSRLTLLIKEKLVFLKPRARIVIGLSEDWDQNKSDALRRLNSSLQNIQIMTYNHLTDSANRMIEYYQPTD